MTAKRITMRKIREILRLRLDAGLSIRQIRASTKASVGSIQQLLARAAAEGLNWPLTDELDDDQLAKLLYPKADTHASNRFEIPTWPSTQKSLKFKGVTLQLLWEEYAEQFPNRCYSYSQFCDLYRRWLKRQKRSMRQTHKAGEKCFVDYCGHTVPIVNLHTGEVTDSQVFVAVLGASNYTFAEATLSQKLSDWLGSHVRMFEFFGGLVETVVPDNLKSGVSAACRYDPDLNPSYQQLSEHYQVAIIPARPYKPKDKAKAEVAVQIVERWILARLRRHTFFSLAELNQCIAALLVELNQKPFQQLPGNRSQAFDEIDRPALRPLPKHPYQYVEIKKVKVNIDYHVQYRHHHYSVPNEYVSETLELHISDTLVTAYFRQRQVASHVRKFSPGITTIETHMPERHQKHQTWTPERLKQWANSIGAEASTWVAYQLDIKVHPEQAYRVCLGLLSLSKKYPETRLNAACGIANRKQLFRLKQVKSILTSNQDQLPDQLDLQIELPQDHDNIRGPKHFH